MYRLIDLYVFSDFTEKDKRRIKDAADSALYEYDEDTLVPNTIKAVNKKAKELVLDQEPKFCDVLYWFEDDEEGLGVEQYCINRRGSDDKTQVYSDEVYKVLDALTHSMMVEGKKNFIEEYLTGYFLLDGTSVKSKWVKDEDNV